MADILTATSSDLENGVQVQATTDGDAVSILAVNHKIRNERVTDLTITLPSSVSSIAPTYYLIDGDNSNIYDGSPDSGLLQTVTSPSVISGTVTLRMQPRSVHLLRFAFPSTPKSDTDTGVGLDAETATVPVSKTGVDTGSGVDTATITAIYTIADTGTGADGLGTRVFSDTESGFGSDIVTDRRIYITDAGFGRTQAIVSLPILGDTPGTLVLVVDAPGVLSLSVDTPGSLSIAADTPGSIILTPDTPGTKTLIVDGDQVLETP